MLGWDHGGWFSLDASLRIGATDRVGLDRLAKILPPPRIHRYSYHGVFAPNAPLRPLVTARAQEANALAAQAPGPPLPLPTRPAAPAPFHQQPPRRDQEVVGCFSFLPPFLAATGRSR